MPSTSTISQEQPTTSHSQNMSSSAVCPTLDDVSTGNQPLKFGGAKNILRVQQASVRILDFEIVENAPPPFSVDPAPQQGANDGSAVAAASSWWSGITSQIKVATHTLQQTTDSLLRTVLPGTQLYVRYRVEVKIVFSGGGGGSSGSGGGSGGYNAYGINSGAGTAAGENGIT